MDASHYWLRKINEAVTLSTSPMAGINPASGWSFMEYASLHAFLEQVNLALLFVSERKLGMSSKFPFPYLHPVHCKHVLLRLGQLIPCSANVLNKSCLTTPVQVAMPCPDWNGNWFFL